MPGHGGVRHVDSVVSPEPPGRRDEVESGRKRKSEGVSATQRGSFHACWFLLSLGVWAVRTGSNMDCRDGKGLRDPSSPSPGRCSAFI